MDKNALFARFGHQVERQKGDILIRQGDVDNSVYLVVSGLLKAYYATLDGKELIKSFIQPGEFIGSLISCRTGEPSTFNLTCLEDCSLRRVSFDELQSAAINQPDIASFINNGLIELAIKKERREYEFLCLSAPERYALLQQRSPQLVERITQNDIARYLGITPVALSRIKKRSNSVDS